MRSGSLFHPIILGDRSVGPVIFTYSGLYGDIGCDRRMEPDVLSTDGGNVNWRDVCAHTDVNDIGGCMRNKGEVVIGVLVTVALISSLLTLGLYKTNKNGVLENNKNKIWCKMQNKGEVYCNALYPDPA